MAEEQGVQPGGGTWEAERLRATTFLLPGAEVARMESWWKDVVEDEPAEVLKRPREGQLQLVGAFEGKRLVLQVHPGRVDWNYVADAGPPDELPGRLPTAGPFLDALQSFSKVVARWLEMCPAVTRLAFGAVLVKPVADRQSGFLALSRLLPSIKIDPDNSLDFLYQINRPRPSESGVDGLRINRLTKWSVMQTIEFVVSADAGARLAHGPSQVVCKLELDVNTAADFSGEIPKDKIGSLYGELVRLGREIADQGDIP